MVGVQAGLGKGIPPDGIDGRTYFNPRLQAGCHRRNIPRKRLGIGATPDMFGA
jgi:hypothetical protein